MRIVKGIAIWLILLTILKIVIGVVDTFFNGNLYILFALIAFLFAIYMTAIALYNHVSPVVTKEVVILSKRKEGIITAGTINLARQRFVTFEFLSDGKTKELMVSEEEYTSLCEFDFGDITLKGFKYIGFKKRENKTGDGCV